MREPLLGLGPQLGRGYISKPNPFRCGGCGENLQPQTMERGHCDYCDERYQEQQLSEWVQEQQDYERQVYESSKGWID